MLYAYVKTNKGKLSWASKQLSPIFMQQPDNIQFNHTGIVSHSIPRCVFCLCITLSSLQLFFYPTLLMSLAIFLISQRFQKYSFLWLVPCEHHSGSLSRRNKVSGHGHQQPVFPLWPHWGSFTSAYGAILWASFCLHFSLKCKKCVLHCNIYYLWCLKLY